MTKTPKIVPVALLLLLLPFDSAFAAAANTNLDQYSKYFYNRYSLNFDSFGLQYIAPNYGVSVAKSPETPREFMALSSYYKYRALDGEVQARGDLRNAIMSSLAYWRVHPKHSFRSFADSIAAFLMIRETVAVPDLLSDLEKNEMLTSIANILPIGIEAEETENRAVIAAAHWQYVNNYLFDVGLITSTVKVQNDSSIKSKIDVVLPTSINSSYWYHEGANTFISPHYHEVTAFMLLWYGYQTGQTRYVEIARRMYLNTKKISFRNGMVEARWNFRPVGLGAQFYVMQGLLGKYFGDDDYRVYLTYSRGSRFFSNPQQPNQLEYHSTLENSAPVYHDDYSFGDVIEIGLVVPSMSNISLDRKDYLSKPIVSSTDPFFQIKNDGRVISINGRKNLLGSFGNFSKFRAR